MGCISDSENTAESDFHIPSYIAAYFENNFVMFYWFVRRSWIFYDFSGFSDTLNI